MEHWSCVTVIRMYGIYSRHGPCLPVMTFVNKADPRYCSLSPAFGFLANFFFLPSFCFHSLLGEPAPSTHPMVCMLLAACPSSEAAEMFFPSSLPPPQVLGLSSHSRYGARQSELLPKPKAFDPCHLPATCHFSTSLSPVLHLSAANLMLAHVLRQYACAVMTGKHTDTPEVSLK